MGISHPVILEPEKKVYHTSYEEGPIVTFYHKEHIELYGLSCASCHKDESCSHCHDMTVAAEDRGLCKSFEEMHETCDNCHGEQGCDRCHAKTERPGFFACHHRLAAQSVPPETDLSFLSSHRSADCATELRVRCPVMVDGTRPISNTP